MPVPPAEDDELSAWMLRRRRSWWLERILPAHWSWRAKILRAKARGEEGKEAPGASARDKHNSRCSRASSGARPRPPWVVLPAGRDSYGLETSIRAPASSWRRSTGRSASRTSTPSAAWHRMDTAHASSRRSSRRAGVGGKAPAYPDERAHPAARGAPMAAVSDRRKDSRPADCARAKAGAGRTGWGVIPADLDFPLSRSRSSRIGTVSGPVMVLRRKRQTRPEERQGRHATASWRLAAFRSPCRPPEAEAMGPGGVTDCTPLAVNQVRLAVRSR